jgi:zinc transporter ZupT
MEAKNELGYKALFGGLIFLLSFVSGAVPQIFVGLFERHKNFIGIANAFGGGVFLATAFIHMLPELIHDIEQLNVGSQEYPTGFLLVLVGYLVLLCLERVAFSHNHHHDEHHHHHGDQFYKIKHHPHHHPEHHNPV